MPTPARQRQGVKYLISATRYGGSRLFCKNPLCDLIISVALQIVCVVSYDAERKQDTPSWMLLNDVREDCDRIRAGEDALSLCQVCSFRNNHKEEYEDKGEEEVVNWQQKERFRNSPLWAAGR